MMVKFSTTSCTLEQFLRLPEFKPALEFIGGRIIQKMSPRFPHSVIQTELAIVLNGFARPRKLGRAYTELRAVFGGAAQTPDVSFYSAGRLLRYLPDDETSDITLAPDIAVEILSPGQTTGELRIKIRHSLKHGSKLGWLIHSARRQVQVFRLGQRVEILKRGDVLGGEDVLPGFALSLDEIFGWLGQE